MTSAYCKYGFETAFGNGTPSSWEYMLVSNVTLSIQTTSQSYNNYNISTPYSYQVANELITQEAVSGSFTFYYTNKTMLDFMKAICWNTPTVSGNIYIIPITDSSLYSMVIEMGDFKDSDNFAFRLNGVIIDSIKFNCRLNDYITVEVGFVAQSYTSLDTTSEASFIDRTPRTFLDFSYTSAGFVDGSTVYLTNLSACSISIKRSLSTDSYIIGSSNIHNFYDSGYAIVTCEITYSEDEYASYDKFFDSAYLSSMALGINANEQFRLDILENRGLNQSISYNINTAGKIEKSLTFKCGHRINADFGV